MAGNTLNVSWEEFHRQARTLAGRLRSIPSLKGIVAVTRGGLVPASVLAAELDIRRISVVGAVGYTAERERDRELKVTGNVGHDGAGWIVVDDLVDSGRTMRHLRTMLPRAHFAAVYAKPEGRPAVDSCVAEVAQDTWIVFPWEKDD
ncbi:MAG: xanthine phosphoribosyltransferase [Desulfovibrionaceae bacterium]|nr:xanthine phosphoribosyltransferase [Desulfovibrionaceae bacterium]